MPCPFAHLAGEKQKRIGSFFQIVLIPAGLVAASVAARMLLSGAIGDRGVLAFFVVPVALSALISGIAGGLVATLLAAIGISYLLSPADTPFGSHAAPDIAIFFAIAAVLLFAIEAFFGAHRETTKAAEALRESELRMRALLENAVDGVVVIDERGIIESVNPASEKLFQYRKEEMLGQNVSMLMPEPYRSEHDTYLRNYLITGRRKIIGIGREVVGRRKDGSLFPMDLSVSEVRVNGRRIFSGMVHDISERKLIEDERKALLASERSARSEAERASRVKDEFLATLSHELRTPLNAILGWTQILTRGSRNPEEVNRALATIERNARVQAKLIDDLLSMSRITSGKLKLTLQDQRLGTVIDAAIESVQPASHARRIEIRKEGDAFDSVVYVDPARLQQIFWNLLANAVKFDRSGGLVRVVATRPDPDNVEVSVIDRGRGISSDFLPLVFQRFRQADSSTTRKYGGLGLGLSIVKHLVELHGGTVRVASEGEGKGATFTVSLPLSQSREQFKISAPASEEQALGLVDIEGARVLVVDDEDDAREIAKRALEDAKAEVLVAESASQAWDLLQSGEPDVLLCDIGMPGEDGFEFIRRVRREMAASIPAAALTAFARSEDRQRALEAGFNMHIVKPVDAYDIILSVAALKNLGSGNVH